MLQIKMSSAKACIDSILFTSNCILDNPGLTHSDTLHSLPVMNGEYRNALRQGYRGWSN